MIGFCLILGSITTSFPEWEGEFDQYEAIYEEALVDPSAFDIIAEQDNRAALVAYVSDEVDVPYVSDREIEDLIAPLIPKGSVVVDHGMGLAPFLSSCTGKEGKVYAFERDPQAFSERYWQLTWHGSDNVFLYCAILRESGRHLDEYALDKVSLICISCGGREDFFLKGAANTIARHRPALLINLIGGISLEQGDRYIKEEVHKRIDEIVRKGYTIRHIRGDLHLALPLYTQTK